MTAGDVTATKPMPGVIADHDAHFSYLIASGQLRPDALARLPEWSSD